VIEEDVRDLATDVLRHRMVLSYDALSEGVTADDLLDRILAAVPEASGEHLIHEAPATARARAR
jgi:MoxR-like ATPase